MKYLSCVSDSSLNHFSCGQGLVCGLVNVKGTSYGDFG